MIKIAICDDDKNIVDNIESLIRENENSLLTSIYKFYDGDELYESVLEGEMFDLIYLDIEMKRMGGMEVAHKIREIDKGVTFIFVSSYRDYARIGYEVSAFRFLDKPINVNQFYEYYNLAISKIEEDKGCFTFKLGHENYRLEIKDIIYFQSSVRQIIVKTNNEDLVYYDKLDKIEAQLLSNGIRFFRISKSVLLNPQYIYSYGSKGLVLKNDEFHEIAKSRRDEIKKLFCDLKCGDIGEWFKWIVTSIN